MKEIQDIVSEMDVPSERRSDLNWLIRNLGIRNSTHAKFETVMKLIKTELKVVKRELYSVYAKIKAPEKLSDKEKLMNILYDGIVTRDYRGNLPFDKAPSQEEIIDLLRLLRPEREYYLGSVKVEYIRDLEKREL